MCFHKLRSIGSESDFSEPASFPSTSISSLVNRMKRRHDSTLPSYSPTTAITPFTRFLKPFRTSSMKHQVLLLSPIATKSTTTEIPITRYFKPFQAFVAMKSQALPFSPTTTKIPFTRFLKSFRIDTPSRRSSSPPIKLPPGVSLKDACTSPKSTQPAAHPFPTPFKPPFAAPSVASPFHFPRLPTFRLHLPDIIEDRLDSHREARRMKKMRARDYAPPKRNFIRASSSNDLAAMVGHLKECHESPGSSLTNSFLADPLGPNMPLHVPTIVYPHPQTPTRCSQRSIVTVASVLGSSLSEEEEEEDVFYTPASRISTSPL